MKNLIELVKNAGVVGAGGAGFPTYQKISTEVEIVIANGAECEPLLYKDVTLMENYPQEIINGMLAVMKHVKAERGIFAVKGKNKKAIEAISNWLPANISLFEMEDVYPAGDEYEVVYHSTGRRIPAGGFPFQIGIVVQNVETFFNIYQAQKGNPVTHSILTVHGDVKKPITAWFPIGMSYADVLEAAGGATIDDYVLIDGGPMMGKVVTDLSTPVTRTSGGFLVLSKETHLAMRKSQSEQSYKRVGKSACDQCSLCTEMCPRYLMGYPIKPHLVMRSLLTTGELSESLTYWAQACCECNICSLWACPEELDPRNICVTTKRDARKNNMWLSADQLQELATDPHPLKEYRGVPTKRLVRKLGLQGYTKPAEFIKNISEPKSVSIPLQQHIGALPEIIVKKGEKVQKGQILAEAKNGELSVPIHASIDGVVTAVGESVEVTKK
ncbi:MAG: NADH dehydrogenase subunit [Calditrichaeota bacterium]|nr:MAG: NADH dehydrogenase subunit [Calditrichota bacterium]MBL1207681.1 NADH dehydrogenase subunit [Calditrichota bacterium]NOG47515.1 NADH dehydrogenase subunit [Calditrichota bacterium]